MNTIEYLDSQTNEWTTFVPQTNQIIDNLMEKQRGALAAEEVISDKVFKPIKRVETNGYHSDSKEETDEEVKSIMASKKEKSVNGYKKDKMKDVLVENGTNVDRSIKVDKLQKIIENNYTEIADNTNS